MGSGAETIPTSEVVTLDGERAVALSHGYAVDGRVSWHPPEARGFAPMNCYLLAEGDDALIVDTGLTVHRDALLRQLDARLGPGARPSILSLRLGEFDSLCNALPIMERFQVERFYAVLRNGPRWGDFLPEPLADWEARTGRRLDDVEGVSLGRAGTIRLGADGGRELEVLFAPLHLIASYWVYDAATRVLLTNDVFTHAIAAAADGPWTIDAGDDDPTSEDDVVAALLGTRYWWLAGARTDRVRAELAAFFERRPVEAIGPAYGRVLRGRAVVERHYDLLDRALARLASAPGPLAAAR